MSSIDLLERVSTGKGLDPRIAVISVLVLVFLCGAAVGALVIDSRLHELMRPPAFDTPAGKAMNFERLRRDLDLTANQAEQVQSILEDEWKYYRMVLTDSKSRVEQVLTKEQREKFERVLQQQR
jgi:uncharacterized membrane protein